MMIMQMRFILCVILCALLISVGMAAKYEFNAGPYIVEFNSSQDLVIQPAFPHEESGSNAGGWDIGIQDNMSHELASLVIVEEDKIALATDEQMDAILDNNFEQVKGLKPKTTIKVDGVNGRMIKAYDPSIGMNVKETIYPFNASYDSFFKQIATKCFVLLLGYDLPVYDEIIDSLNITTN